ncbi:MAG: M14 family zinc carboxypeptidase, partial [Acidobacteriota bacterium]
MSNLAGPTATSRPHRLVALALLLSATLATGTQAGAIPQHGETLPAEDDAYTAKIHEYTTEPYFLTPLVESLPASDTVPTTLDLLGYIAGAEGHLTYAADVHRYMRALAAASPRVEVHAMGRTEEGRERLVVVISDEQTLANLAHYKQITARLADPRGLSEEEAHRLIAEGKPFYWAVGGLHSPETGSPEMLMELAYRLAVAERPLFQQIRDNS